VKTAKNNYSRNSRHRHFVIRSTSSRLKLVGYSIAIISNKELNSPISLHPCCAPVIV
jgi:hypothetical protein